MIYDKDLIMHTKFKHPGATKSGEVNLAITSASIGNGGSKVYKVSIPRSGEPFSSAQVYVQDPRDASSWYRTPDLLDMDFIPVTVGGVLTPESLEIQAVYKNTFGGTLTVAPATIKFKYFLME